MDKRCWLPVCVILLMELQVSSQERVKGFTRGKVILPCRYNAMPTEKVTMFWRYKDDRNVYNIVSGKADLTDQDRQFRDRIRIFPEEWANGNFSLLLTDLKDSDSGSYSCFIPTEDILRQVELSVQEKPTPEPEVGPKSSSMSIRVENLSPFLFLLLSPALHFL
ncbi:CD276 antigen homolog isoform X2 [Salvelinus fontinalis]|uniref:CD276 antigen homolog n=1 Tax=Salvelinus namaycush TaxID=8040 RepID=A0A8U0QCZ1_SALNM|nr:CD276 antigen homolog [Salvelinus namaycush]XP_038854321.1 CD276 antigen homolog [Salvelinus namaycush]XP_055786176.1 CD276 antigen homolog isoform X2 [Salvelinus fontinalis]